jgi:peptidyl-prolyl cis-trans isomerase A (cyclophilin A)
MISLVRSFPSLCLILFLALSCTKGPAEKIPAADAVETPPAVEEEPPVPYDLENLPDHPVVLMSTTLGDITIELDNVKAPISTKNFLTYVQSGFYDGTIFHRVIPNFMIQGGGYAESLYENINARPKTPREMIKNEAKNGLSNANGTISMARRPKPHTASSQFFINVKDNKGLDHSGPGDRQFGYAVFGKVTAGLNVVEAIRITPTKVASRNHPTVPETPVVIKSVKPLAEK